MADPYITLSVPRTADAAAIKRAYRKLAKQYHPDKNADNPKALERFKAVSAAYDILGDEKKRGQFDRGEIDGDGNARAPNFDFNSARRSSAGAGPGAGGGFGGGAQGGGFEFAGDPSDLFAELFGAATGRRGGAGAAGGGFRQPPQKGQDTPYRLRVSFVDAALARTQRLTLASGKTIDLAIPKGVEEGDKLRLAGQGENGPGGAGDAIVTLMIMPDARFVRDGADIRTDLAVPLEAAVLGGKLRVPTLEGEVMLSVAPGTSSGKVMRLKGKGWTAKDGSRGDLLARVMVEVPNDPALADFLRARVSAA